MPQRCQCRHLHRCRYCMKTALCHANYCSSNCYRNDAAGGFRPLGPEDFKPGGELQETKTENRP